MKRLEKDEALRAPLYLVAALLVLLPGIDFLHSVGAPQFGNIQWRFATVGVLSSYLATPLLGAGIALAVAVLADHHGVRRSLTIACFVVSAGLVVLSLGFALDVLQLRGSVRPDALQSFQGASARAALKLLLVATGLGFLAWRATRIPAPGRPPSLHRGPVPLVNGPDAQAEASARSRP